MADEVEVRVTGRGIVRGEQVHVDGALQAQCGLCGITVEAVVSVPAASGPATFACAGCLRGRLEAITLGRWHLRAAGGSSLPWGKISG
jgi:hypothetical protein